MSEFKIEEEQFSALAGKNVVLTGGSSGIGLATAEFLLSLGAAVVMGDLNDSPTKHPKLTFVKTDVTNWADLKALFNKAKELHGRIDHVFANAGISSRNDYMNDSFDENGELLEPATPVYDIMLRGMMNTSYLGFHHMRTQEPPGGSVVVTASASSFQRFRATDYTVAKHGILGFMRGMTPNLADGSAPIRINGISPSWTATGIVPKELLDKVGIESQSPEVVAKSVALLMADEARRGQLIYSALGRYWEIEESLLLKSVEPLIGPRSDDDVINRFKDLARQGAAK